MYFNGLEPPRVDGTKAVLLQTEAMSPRPSSRGDGHRRLPVQDEGLKRLEKVVTSRAVMTSQDIKDLRKALGLSQVKLAKIIGVARMTIYRAERYGPSRPVVMYIENALATGKLKLSNDKIHPEK